jgi:hypothetical protein
MFIGLIKILYYTHRYQYLITQNEQNKKYIKRIRMWKVIEKAEHKMRNHER